MDDIKNIIISLVLIIGIITIGQLVEVYNTQYVNLFIIILLILWVSFMIQVFKYMIDWYRKDLLKRTEDEVERRDSLSDEELEDEDSSWIPKLW